MAQARQREGHAGVGGNLDTHGVRFWQIRALPGIDRRAITHRGISQLPGVEDLLPAGRRLIHPEHQEGRPGAALAGSVVGEGQAGDGVFAVVRPHHLHRVVLWEKATGVVSY